MHGHKDGHTARCPWFEARINYLGGYWIECAGRSVKFPDRITRDAGYVVFCCKYGTDRPDRCQLCGIANQLRREST